METIQIRVPQKEGKLPPKDATVTIYFPRRGRGMQGPDIEDLKLITRAKKQLKRKNM